MSNITKNTDYTLVLSEYEVYVVLKALKLLSDDDIEGCTEGDLIEQLQTVLEK